MVAVQTMANTVILSEWISSISVGMSMELLQPCQVNISLNQVFGDKMSEKLPWKNHILREDAGR